MLIKTIKHFFLKTIRLIENRISMSKTQNHNRHGDRKKRATFNKKRIPESQEITDPQEIEKKAKSLKQERLQHSHYPPRDNHI